MVRKIIEKPLESDLDEVLEDLYEDSFSSFLGLDEEIMDDMMENENKFEKMKREGLEKEITEITKYEGKRMKILSFDFNKKSSTALGKFVTEADNLAEKYIKSIAKLSEYRTKLIEFSDNLFEHPMNMELEDQIIYSSLMSLNIENTCKGFVLELNQKKLELEIFRQEERLRKLEEIVCDTDKK